MIFASTPDLGKSESLLALAQDLAHFVTQAVHNQDSLDDLERGVLARLLAMGHAAVEMFLQAQGDGDLGETLTTQQGAVLQRSDAPARRPLRTIFGEHDFWAYVYSQGDRQKIELRPIDARLNLPAGKASYLLEEFSQMFCVEKAFRTGARQFHKVFGQKLSVDVLEGINRQMGQQAADFLSRLPAPPPAQEGTILVVSADAKGVPLVQEDARRVPAFDRREPSGNRRMATLGCCYSVAPHMRTPEQVVAALFAEAAAPPPPDRPEPCHKRYRAYFACGTADEAIPGGFRTWTWLSQEVRMRLGKGGVVVRLMDGQASLWQAADACLEEELARRREAGCAAVVVDILDIIHAAGYVWKAAKAFYGHKEHQEAFARERLLRILRGEVSGVVRGMRRMATERGLRGQALREVTTACNYLEGNAHRMRYDEYLRAGYPIATGVIEGACRHVVKDRMEQGGMRWRLAGAQAMLDVRCVSASGEAEAFGRWRQAEQAKRVHPHRALVAPTQDFKG